ncbi:MAG: cell wall-binding repeat-containing protein, partial [Finegoldia magna]
MKNKKILGLMLTGVILANIIPQVSFAAKDVDIQRIKGNNRYDTSIEISKHAFSKSDKVVVVSGEKFADALTAGNFANQAPILLTEKAGASSDLQKEIDRLGAKEIIIIGGKGSVSESVEKTLKLQGKKITRISGNDRYETSTKVAEALNAKNN